MSGDSQPVPSATGAQDQPGLPEPQAAPGLGKPASRLAVGVRALRGQVITASETWTLLALIILCVFFTVRAPGKFLTLTNFSLIGQDSAWYLVMAVGQTFVILTAGIDLAVGSVLVLSGVVADLFCIHNGGANAGWGIIVVGIIVGIAVGCGWGAMQGFLIAKAKVAPLIATLAGFGAAGGAAYLITGGADLRTVPSRLVNTIGLGSVLGLPWLIVISVGVTIVFGLILAYTRFGLYTYAIGSNAEAARRSGIAVDRHLIKVYALSGLMSGLAGILSLANFSSTTIAGHGLDNLTVITGVVLGGVSLFGGRGSMLGTFIGLAIPAVLLSGLIIIQVNEYWQDVAIGAVLVGAVYLDQFRRRLRERT
ncbi:MAG TPA: ABC transporter permease [Streptosporangiaceae bacterium]|nr:ABC transporter permease [Streptosporangiaceae bacterium]